MTLRSSPACPSLRLAFSPITRSRLPRSGSRTHTNANSRGTLLPVFESSRIDVLRVGGVSSLVLGLVLVLGASATAPQAKAETAWLGIVAGPPAGSEAVQAADMASLFKKDEALRVVPMLGDSGAGLLLNDPSVDIAFVSTDALSAAAAPGATLSDHVELVARLAPQEVHVLARTEIGSLAELAGKKVSVGPQGSSSAATAATLFKALGITVEAESLDASAAIERLKQGMIDAVVIVGGKPYPLISAVPANSGIHLLPIPFGAPVEAAYLPTRFEQRDYPNLIQPGGEVPTVATGMVLLAAKRDPLSAARVAHFVEALFPRFAELQASDRPEMARSQSCCESAWIQPHGRRGMLNKRSADIGAKPIAASPDAVQRASRPAGAMTKGDKEVLFKQFIEWQRSKGH
jgi:uncharacterized protein